jgi:chromatin remodeling complex protein RSC6
MAPKKSSKAQEQPASVTPEPVKETKPVKEVAPAPVADDAATEVSSVDKFASVVETLQTLQNQIKDLVSVVKGLQKEYSKLQKQKSKKTTRKASGDEASGAKRAPSGFAKPAKLSDQLCDFLGVAHGTSMARTEVTRVINEYIKKNSLQDSADRRKIVPDAKLKGILKIDDEKGLSYFTLQSSIKHHFQKA